MSILTRSLSTALVALALASASGAHAALTLNPISTAGSAVGGGLSATWLQVANDSYFSAQPWTEGGSTAPIGSYGWGSGIWGTMDVSYLMGLSAADPLFVGRVTGTSAISFANSIYNDLAGDGSYGSWGYDYVRALAPIVGDTGQQTNYAARFTGYLYVAEAGVYDFGLFADDGFVFSLTGSDGSYGLEHATHAGSSGRDYYTLSGANGSGVELGVGYYGISLDYYNRLEAGVIDLAWWAPGSGNWSSIGEGSLFDSLPAGGRGGNVPEPGMLSLVGLAGMLALARRRRGS